MSYDDAPVSVRSLEQHIRNLEGSEGRTLRRHISVLPTMEEAVAWTNELIRRISPA